MIQQSSAALAVGTRGFGALGVSDDVVAVLDEQGITAPFPVQTAAIPEALRGGDVLAKSPTGSGKTLTFAIPDRRAPRLPHRPRGPASARSCSSRPASSPRR